MHFSLSHILPFSTTGFYAKVSLLRNFHSKCNCTPPYWLIAHYVPDFMISVGNMGRLRLTQTPISWSLYLFLDIYPLRKDPCFLIYSEWIPTDPLSTLVHDSSRLKVYRNGTLCTNSLCLGQRPGSAKKKHICLARKWDQNQKEENPFTWGGQLAKSSASEVDRSKG